MNNLILNVNKIVVEGQNSDRKLLMMNSCLIDVYFEFSNNAIEKQKRDHGNDEFKTHVQKACPILECTKFRRE